MTRIAWFKAPFEDISRIALASMVTVVELFLLVRNSKEGEGMAVAIAICGAEVAIIKLLKLKGYSSSS